MSVKFKFENILDNVVKIKFANLCQKYKTLFSPEPVNLDPNTTSAFPSNIGFNKFLYSDGSYSKSAS